MTTITKMVRGGILMLAACMTLGVAPAQADLFLVRFTPAGRLDPNFSFDGLTRTYLGASNNGADESRTAVAIDQSGRVLVAADFNGPQGAGPHRLAVFRYLPNGSLDATFGSGGTSTVSFTQTVSGSHTMVIDASGRILLAASLTSSPSTSPQHRLVAVRLKPSGVLDTSFGVGGVAKAPAFQNTFESVGGIAIDSAQRVVVTGVRIDPEGRSYSTVVARFTGSGQIDTSFAGTGQAVYKFPTLFRGPTFEEYADAFTNGVVTDGTKIVLSSMSQAFPGSPCSHANVLVRLDDVGRFDTTFGSNGVMDLRSCARDYLGPSIARAGTRYVVASQGGRSGGLGVGQALSTGTWDLGFDVDGWNEVDFPLSSIRSTTPIAASASGVVTVATHYVSPIFSGIALARLRPTGKLDTTFGSGGRVVLQMTPPNIAGVPHAVAVDAVGGVVVAGQLAP